MNGSFGNGYYLYGDPTSTPTSIIPENENIKDLK
jgi:hypothetical protein